MSEFWSWVGPLSLITLIALLLLNLWHGRRQRVKGQSAHREYLKGLNFVLNEETDKAIDVFIRALEVDKETVELHFALGGLFRRSGQFDRASRIHQNLIARPALNNSQRQQAVYELAQDYHKVGWLDRAENLYRELLSEPDLKPLAIDGLVALFHQQKEWQKAIDCLQLHRPERRAKRATEMANFYCELAESAIQRQTFDAAADALSLAQKVSAKVGRVGYLRGELCFAEGDFNMALKHWNTLRRDYPRLAHLVVGTMIEAYQALGDQAALTAFLHSDTDIPREKLAFLQWQSALHQALGESSALEVVMERVQRHGLNGPASSYLLKCIKQNKISDQRRSALLAELLNREKNSKIEYTCAGCGFDTRAMYWHCPNCGRWESFQ